MTSSGKGGLLVLLQLPEHHQHLLPLLFEGCSVEPSLECALVKLALIAVGALGLYCTRSLYGEDGRPEYAHVNFSRIA